MVCGVACRLQVPTGCIQNTTSSTSTSSYSCMQVRAIEWRLVGDCLGPDFSLLWSHCV
jgi:hypothetical protein